MSPGYSDDLRLVADELSAGRDVGLVLVDDLFAPTSVHRSGGFEPRPLLTKFEFRALDVAAPNVHGSAAGVDDRLMSGVVEPAMAPAKLHGESPRGLHINMYGLTIGMPPWSHADGRSVGPQEVIGAHDVIERINFEHHMLQPGRLARHTRRESDVVMTRVAAQKAQTYMVVDAYPVAQAKAQHTGVKVV